ncbi:2-polyprenyl-3-methyl-5-hydroxy-6-metoxy-1,4-benzoquinol methylase [Pseudomonas citronellolis]|uniref:class I SAM-dependent methyltransferase n=1 Tax=Pseudomonas citronellolis TaxID=53408 RepID=UPI0020A228D4|nr:class I SAM-dependent methyltransferase [Pseudomonas citronellolis]MCP1646295.1 2-polyprenyl-3-methyl-5-hydroxy-6-metoxy-1,4-benzoquinol methylase [Pseudomonas citronellolis]MCP1669215.1 2-polyprenyl-3-methyl-5-hydroxy-6-metoxy-1,4-benzoquinol methylase [Pseudomonas citronellolis]MCP1700883.1 2-polyprenyl-3-methyl-5-hydroxy-6-metoxy-1,4-benzoquinol methylase [Pseudomonas citronellolis]MCP1707079.1 2-polyprenyl-3-methyl-5-hydroxy-6-metoxy-1,4-benzoquinol methylase [Pseudomonas citronellolis]
MDLKESEILGAAVEEHWYYSSKAKALSSIVGRDIGASILDVGAGSAFFSRHLLANTTASEAWCVDTSYVDEKDEVISGKLLHLRKAIGHVGASLVLLMDVIEHVDDDVELLALYRDKVPAGTRFLVTVPAFQFLWSSHDEFLEHRRRYTLPQLENTLRKAGLKIKKSNYFFGSVFPLAAVLRLLERVRHDSQPPRSQLTRHSPLVNTTLRGICQMETFWMRHNRLAGLSVFCLAET